MKGAARRALARWVSSVEDLGAMIRTFRLFVSSLLDLGPLRFAAHINWTRFLCDRFDRGERDFRRRHIQPADRVVTTEPGTHYYIVADSDSCKHDYMRSDPCPAPILIGLSCSLGFESDPQTNRT